MMLGLMPETSIFLIASIPFVVLVFLLVYFLVYIVPQLKN
jgi:hypothetical protein